MQRATRQIGTMLAPFFSVVMPSYLGHYANAATDREDKFIRAVESVQAQSYLDWELVIVSDGCEDTVQVYMDRFSEDPRIKCINIPKVPIWSTVVRNTGIQFSEGKYISYLDTDDFFGVDHLSKLHDGLKAEGLPEWAFFNDMYWNAPRSMFVERVCDPEKKYHHGTANFVHINGLRWPADASYRHDQLFCQSLRARSKGVRIPTGEYFTCHDPGKIDV